MASGAPADAIFIKEGQLEPNGPHSKDQVLGWYNENSFDNPNVRFAFLTGDEQLTEQTEYHTLGDLIAYNGARDPFLHKPISNEMEDLREALKRSKRRSIRQPPPTSSSSAADVKIYYKDEEDWFHGPYMEHEVLFRRNMKWLKNSFPFYFMLGDERPNMQTKSHTLGQLINRINSPFYLSELAMRLANRIVGGDEECSPPTTSYAVRTVANATVATQSEENSYDQTGEEDRAFLLTHFDEDYEDFEDDEGEEEEIEQDDSVDQSNRDDARLDKMANAWAAYYLDVLEAYKTKDWFKVEYSFNESMRHALESESLREKCRKELENKLRELDYAYCSECDSIFHSNKQMVMHVNVKHRKTSSDELDQQMKAVNEMMNQICEPWLKIWKEEEDKFPKEDIQKYTISFGSFGLPVPNLHPTKEFVADFKHKHRLAFFSHRENAGLSNEDMLAKMIPCLKNDKDSNADGLEVFNELHEHIADAKTRCFYCNVVTGYREDYYNHVRTADHIRKADGKDLITLVVNMYKKD